MRLLVELDGARPRLVVAANRIHDGEYDAVPSDPDAYLRGVLTPAAEGKKAKA